MEIVASDLIDGIITEGEQRLEFKYIDIRNKYKGISFPHCNLVNPFAFHPHMTLGAQEDTLP